MKTRLKKYLNKHKNRIFSLIAVMVFIPMFSFNAFALNVNDLAVNGLVNTYYLGTTAENNGVRVVITANGSYAYDKTISLSSTMLYQCDNTLINNVSEWRLGTPSISFDFPYAPDLYDYYLYVTYYSKDLNTNFVPSSIATRDYSNNHTTGSTRINITDYVIYNSTDSNQTGYTILAKIPYMNTININVLDMYGSGTLGANLAVEGLVFCFEKGTQNAVSSIITAINNQTSALSGKIDDTNDYINFGNGSTGGIVSDNNSAIDNLDEVVSEYHATEQQFFDDFTANQQAINSDIVGWSWGGLVNCANWVGETMTDYYNNMGDFRQYIIYPLMLGIVLFFLGRGGAIIGHLFRKPTQSTVNIESTSFKRGNTRYTTTTTSKKGGVFRK